MIQLFYGCRDLSSDLLRDETEPMNEILTRHSAYSRQDGRPKEYVQVSVLFSFLSTSSLISPSFQSGPTTFHKGIFLKQTPYIKYNVLSMDDSSNGRAVALYPADPGSNPRFGSV